MDERRWRQIQEIFARTADLPADAQRAAVEEICEGDDSLQGEVRDEVLAMLEEDHLNNPLLDSSLDETARAVLDFGPLPSLIQREIGPYRLLRLLGEGGMGVVYLGERTDIGGQVAIKFLRDGWLSPMRRQRFRMEQLTLAQLNHPGIARIYDSNMLEDGTPWFVMEYADGLPLTGHWSHHGGTIRDCLRLMRKVCEAVQYAHSHAIIHRDLKPSNILVTECRLDRSSSNSLNDAVAHVKLGRALLREGRFSEAEPETLFGYNYLIKKVAPTDRFLAVARKDLAAINDGLHQPDKAAHYRSELGAAAQTAQ